ncbi:MAG TPA: N-acetyl-alpha-D-glucosaminyl L-malate synthase BshA [Phycisphaerae bacterium]|nr:N-acetyl-alpha-D-glucosaminyl L-malate synthase BshA [Phycisphaerae bacterium]
MTPLRIGITCYPTVGGSGVLASALGEELASRGHEVHFISYERPFRLAENAPRIHFHPVDVSDYDLFKYPDYTLPLSVKMAEVTRDFGLDILHVHYAVPHATAALLARDMLPPEIRPRIVTTLHGTDTTLLGSDRGYGPAILHALRCSDAVTTVSAYLKAETQRRIGFTGPIDVIHNFFKARAPKRSREEVRCELGIKPSADDELLVLHISNLRPLKRIDLLLRAFAQIHSPQPRRLVILAGDSFSPFEPLVRELKLCDAVTVREGVADIEDYLQAADAGLFTSETESFCLGILEAMCFGCPSIAMSVGGIPEVIDDGITGVLVPFGDTAAAARAFDRLFDAQQRRAMGDAARIAARARFSADAIVPLYEGLYRRLLARAAAPQ